MKFFLIFLLSTFFPHYVHAAEKVSEEEMKEGRLAYSSFECSVAAAMANLDEENARLFTLGYDAATNFFSSTRNKELNTELVNDSISFKLVTLVSINNDFDAGRLYQNTYEIVFEKVGNPIDSKKQNKEALRYYNDKNCSMIK